MPAVLGDFLVDRGIGPFQIGICVEGGSSVSGAGDIENAGLIFGDEAIQVHVNEAEAGGSSPMAEQPRLDVSFRRGSRSSGFSWR